jgi:hypothetical protein
MPDVEINVEETPSEEIEVEETPSWAFALLESNRETANLLRDVLGEVRQSNQASSTLVPSLLETNQSLTRQLQEMPRATMDLLTPLLSPPVVIETLPTDEPSLEESAIDPLEVPPVAEVTEVPPERQRRKFRPL